MGTLLRRYHEDKPVAKKEQVKPPVEKEEKKTAKKPVKKK